MIDLGENSEDPACSSDMGQDCQCSLPPMFVDKKRPNQDSTGVQHPVRVHTVSSVPVPIRPVNNAVQCTILDHTPWYPNAGTEHDKKIRKENIDAMGLVLVDFLVPKLSMNPKECGEMVKVRVVVNIICVTVVGERVLMLPQDWVAQQAHGPHANVIYRRVATGGKVPSVVTKASQQPTKDGKGETTKDATLSAPLEPFHTRWDAYAP